MSDTTWNTIELSIVRALAIQVRAMTSNQIARGWFDISRNPQKAAKATLRRLASAGLIESVRAEAPVPLRLSRPLLQWKTGGRRPSDDQLVAVAASGRKRASLTHSLLTIYRASRRAYRVFGSFADEHQLRWCEIGHDLHLAEVFVAYRSFRPDLARLWLGEGAFPKLGFHIRGMKDPDAFLVDASGRARRVIEFVGSYEVDHLQAFHAHCSAEAARRLRIHRGLKRAFRHLYPDEGIGYELW